MALLNYTPSQRPSFELLYQDDHLLVLNKASGLLSVPGKATEHKDSLQLRVQRVFPTASIVHRLDMATSGIMLMALNRASHRHLSRQFELKKISKVYLAKVYGQPKAERGSIELPLICDWPNRPKQMVDFERGKPAVTHWKTLETYRECALMQLSPITGRSHQLRVHMLRLGHPILGDRLYAHPKALVMAERLQLHAQSIEFLHPQSEKAMQFQQPADFA